MNAPSSKAIFLIALGFASLCLSACAPYRFNDAPAVVGQVVDRTTHRPVVGARVVMVAEKASVQTTTDQSGSFHLPALHHWGVVPFPTDGYSDSEGSLRIEATGYQKFEALDRERIGIGLERVHVALTPGA